MACINCELGTTGQHSNDIHKSQGHKACQKGMMSIVNPSNNIKSQDWQNALGSTQALARACDLLTHGTHGTLFSHKQVRPRNCIHCVYALAYEMLMAF